MDNENLPVFEKDPDQSGAPEGHTAYILRWWWTVIEAESVVRVDIWNNDRPFVKSVGEAAQRPPRFPGETSRLFVRNDAYIDPKVLELRTSPLPTEVPKEGLIDRDHPGNE